MAAIIGTAATIVAGGASLYNSAQQWDAAQEAKKDAKKIQKLRNTQAADILEQIGNEELLYEDDLEMVRKQTALAEEKLDLQMASAFDQTGDTLSNVVAGSYKSKYEGGAGRRSARQARQEMEKQSVDLLESFEMGQKEIALQNEQSEREAERRKDDIIGSLEATYMELTGEEMPTGETTPTNAPALDGMSEEEIDDLYDDQAQED